MYICTYRESMSISGIYIQICTYSRIYEYLRQIEVTGMERDMKHLPQHLYQRTTHNTQRTRHTTKAVRSLNPKPEWSVT